MRTCKASVTQFGTHTLTLHKTELPNLGIKSALCNFASNCYVVLGVIPKVVARGLSRGCDDTLKAVSS